MDETRFPMKHNIKHITETWKHKSKAKFMNKFDAITLTKQHPYQTRFKIRHNIKHITETLKHKSQVNFMSKIHEKTLTKHYLHKKQFKMKQKFTKSNKNIETLKKSKNQLKMI